MKIYTKTGDKGTSSLYDGNRISKNSVIFETIGEVDELTSRIGMACASSSNNYLAIQLLRKVQCKLQDINSIVATIDTTGKTLPEINDDDVVFLESKIDEFEKFNDSLTAFILPGVTVLDSQLHFCRTQARKVERMLWNLQNDDSIVVAEKGKTVDIGKVHFNTSLLKYVNRLSDFFFAFARYICKKQGEKDCFVSDNN